MPRGESGFAMPRRWSRQKAAILAILITAFFIPALAIGLASAGASTPVQPAPKGLCADMTTIADTATTYLEHPSTSAELQLTAALATTARLELTPQNPQRNQAHVNASTNDGAKALVAEMWAQDVGTVDADTLSSLVPPPVIAANRAQLRALVATNFFGQSTPAIAGLESQYEEMWAQDVSASQAPRADPITKAKAELDGVDGYTTEACPSTRQAFDRLDGLLVKDDKTNKVSDRNK
jgi:hypothetical protein